MKRLKTKYFLDKPEQIKVSLTNVCNYRCVMCYNPKLKQARGFISDELMFRILDECRKEGIPRVALGATGEPLLHKNYLVYLERAKALGLSASTTSNCTFLTEEAADAILTLGLDRLNISLYSSTQEEHQQYTGADNFDKVVDNIRYFLNAWHEQKSRMEINMWFLQSPGVNNYENYLNLWKPLCDRIGIPLPLKNPINWSGRVNMKEMASSPWLMIDRLGFHIRVSWRHQGRCGHVRYYLHVLHTGEVLPCCNIPEAIGFDEISFGDLRNTTLMQIWHNGKYRLFKEDHYRKNINGYRPCRMCSDVQTVSCIHIPPLALNVGSLGECK